MVTIKPLADQGLTTVSFKPLSDQGFTTVTTSIARGKNASVH